MGTMRAIGFNEHLAFFDENGDHKISPRESKRGLERLGFGHLLTVPAAFVINFGVATLALLRGRPLNPANLELPATGFVRHPDTDLIDDQGNLDERRLREAFKRHGKTFYGAAVTLSELASLLGARVVEDASGSPLDMLMLPLGASAAAVEWGALFFVAGHMRAGKHVLERETVRRFYTDPEFFDDVAIRVAKVRAIRSRSKLGSLRNFIQDWLL
jgi:hypothetical protein